MQLSVTLATRCGSDGGVQGLSFVPLHVLGLTVSGISLADHTNAACKVDWAGRRRRRRQGGRQGDPRPTPPATARAAARAGQ